jgi:hypothetical protein
VLVVALHLAATQPALSGQLAMPGVDTFTRPFIMESDLGKYH